MPVASLPDVLRRRLSPFEQNVLLLAQRGGVRLVVAELGARASGGVQTVEDAERVLAETRAKAGRILAAAGATTNGNGNGRTRGMAMCAQHGEYTDRGRGCPACNPREGGGERPRPGGERRPAELPPLAPTAPRRPGRRAREEQRERTAAGEREALRRKALEVAGVEDEASPVLSEQDCTISNGEAAGERADPPSAPPAASLDPFDPPKTDPPDASADPLSPVDGADDQTGGPQLGVRRPTDEERAEREEQVEKIREHALRQEIADDGHRWSRTDQHHTAAGASVEEQLADRIEDTPEGRQRSKADIERGRARILVLLAEGPKSQHALALLLGRSRQTVVNDLKRLAAEGDVERTSRHVFDWPADDDGERRGRASTQWRITAEAHVGHAKALIAGEEVEVKIEDDEKGHGDADAGGLVAGGLDGDGGGRGPADAVPDGETPEPAASGDERRADAAAEAERDEEAPAPAVEDPRKRALLNRIRRRREASEREQARLAGEMREMAEEMVATLDAEVPETLLRARYLAVLLKRIEAGDTSPDLLDRFERLAGFAE